MPIVEPEVLMEGTHSLERCAEVTVAMLRAVYEQLSRHHVVLMLRCRTWDSVKDRAHDADACQLQPRSGTDQPKAWVREVSRFTPPETESNAG